MKFLADRVKRTWPSQKSTQPASSESTGPVNGCACRSIIENDTHRRVIHVQRVAALRDLISAA